MKVGGIEIRGVVLKWNVNEVSGNGQYLADVCAERGLFLAVT